MFDRSYHDIPPRQIAPTAVVQASICNLGEDPVDKVDICDDHPFMIIENVTKRSTTLPTASRYVRRHVVSSPSGDVFEHNQEGGNC